MLHEHAFLTTPQLVALGFASLRMTQARLRVLHTLGVTDQVQPFTAATRLPLHHILGPAGARVIAAEEHLAASQLSWRHDRALAIAFAHTLPHDRATHDLICAMATTPGITLTRWWSATRCARYFGHHTRPDAYLALTHNPPRPTPARPPGGGRGWWEAFLEYDTGTEALHVLAAKIHGYHRLAAATGITTPVLIFTARPGREPGARTALADTLRALPQPALVPIATGTPGTPQRVRASMTGPAPGGDAAGGRVWLPLTLHPGPDLTRPPRLTLAELAAMTPPQVQAGHPYAAPPRDLRDPRRQPSPNPVDVTRRSFRGGDALADAGPDGLYDLSHDAGNSALGINDPVGIVELPAPPPHPPQAAPGQPSC